ncbi:bile acid:sodium symporter family protein [soil metagenome]
MFSFSSTLAVALQDVAEAPAVVTEFEQLMLVALLFVIMFGMGASLTPRDFISAIKKPWGLIIGWVTQFGIMPLIAFTMVMVLGLPPWIAVGALLMGSVPGGTTSNIFTYFSKGNLALSVLMTTNSTLWALIMTPLVLVIYGSALGAAGAQIPIQNIVVTLAILLVPVGISMFIRSRNANVGAVLELMGGFFGVFVILFLIVTWVPRNWQLLLDTPWNVYFVAMMLGPIGIAIAYWLAKALKLHPMNARTVGLETGIQNGPLAIGIVILSFSGTEMDQAILIPVLYSLFIVIAASFITLYFRRANTAEEQKIPSLL